jgi:hypothetical protein
MKHCYMLHPDEAPDLPAPGSPTTRIDCADDSRSISWVTARSIWATLSATRIFARSDSASSVRKVICRNAPPSLANRALNRGKVPSPAPSAARVRYRSASISTNPKESRNWDAVQIPLDRAAVEGVNIRRRAGHEPGFIDPPRSRQ